jgi:hypothetical protein
MDTDISPQERPAPNLVLGNTGRLDDHHLRPAGVLHVVDQGMGLEPR